MTFKLHFPIYQMIPLTVLLTEVPRIRYTSQRIAVLFSRNNSDASSIMKELKSSRQSTNVMIKYLDEVKGIEFEKVYVVQKDMSSNERYIAFTRALEELIIVD